MIQYNKIKILDERGFNSFMGNVFNETGFNSFYNKNSVISVMQKSAAEGWVLSNKIFQRIKASNDVDFINIADALFSKSLGEKEAATAALVTSINKREFDASVAKKYADKYQNSLMRGIEFDLSFTDMKMLLSQKKCYYTGVELTTKLDPTTNTTPDNYLTIERLDNTLGYVKGNVVACSYKANQWKSIVVENNTSGMSNEDMYKVMAKIVGK